jgi:hypothetical protein
VLCANVCAALIGAKVITILTVVMGEREADRKYTVVVMHSLHVSMCLYSFWLAASSSPLAAVQRRLHLTTCRKQEKESTQKYACTSGEEKTQKSRR